MPAVQAINDRARAALGAEAVRLCATRVARVTGTHALLLDGSLDAPLAAPDTVACCTALRHDVRGGHWCGPVRAELAALPFVDEAFCVVCVYFPGAAGVAPEALAGELARVLSAHGVLQVIDMHPAALWRAPCSSPWRWERALRGAGLEVAPAQRFGAPWPRTRGSGGLPRWLVRTFGAGWLVTARPRNDAGVTIMRPAFRTRSVREPGALLPGASAHRQRA